MKQLGIWGLQAFQALQLYGFLCSCPDDFLSVHQLLESHTFLQFQDLSSQQKLLYSSCAYFQVPDGKNRTLRQTALSPATHQGATIKLRVQSLQIMRLDLQVVWNIPQSFDFQLSCGHPKRILRISEFFVFGDIKPFAKRWCLEVPIQAMSNVIQGASFQVSSAEPESF